MTNILEILSMKGNRPSSEPFDEGITGLLVPGRNSVMLVSWIDLDVLVIETVNGCANNERNSTYPDGHQRVCSWVTEPSLLDTIVVDLLQSTRDGENSRASKTREPGIVRLTGIGALGGSAAEEANRRPAVLATRCTAVRRLMLS